MKGLLKKLYPLRLAPVSPDMDKFTDILLKELPFKVREYPSCLEHNGWSVPYSWSVEKALIKKNGKIVYDGKRSPLGVMGYARSFKGTVSLETLKKHLAYRKDRPCATGYHCDYFYKPWLSEWGFSIPYNLYKKLKKGRYEIDLKTSFSKGRMKVFDYFFKGDEPDTIILNAHNCHAAQANDDISGVVVAIEAIRRLKKRERRKYSYRVIVAPEHYGTVFYLAGLKEQEIRNFKCGIFLEMLGNDNRFALQESFTGAHLIDKAAHLYLKEKYSDYRWDKFRRIVGNDETVWESAGYEIPCISLSRFPYPQYHTDTDNERIISAKRLEEAVDAVTGIIDIMETDTAMKRKFKGLVALSNPKYGLYKPAADPSTRPRIAGEEKRWNYLMDCLPRYFDGKTKITDIALKHGLNYFALYEYIRRFRDKGLVYFVKPPGDKA